MRLWQSICRLRLQFRDSLKLNIQRELAHAAADGPELDAACLAASGASSQKRYALASQIEFGEFGVLFADIREPVGHVAASEELCFQPLALGANAEQPVHQQLH